MSMRVSTWCCAVAMALTLAAPVLADEVPLPLTGTRSSEELSLTGKWAGTDVTFEWAVVYIYDENDLDPGPDAYQYIYVFSGVNEGPLTGDISHVIVEASPSFTEQDLWGANMRVDEVRIWEPGESGNPNWPVEKAVNGIKFENHDANPLYLTFFSLRDPVPGMVYAKGGGGKKDPSTLIAWNVPVPDTKSSLKVMGDPVPDLPAAPLPSAAWAGMALLGAVVARRKLRGH